MIRIMNIGYIYTYVGEKNHSGANDLAYAMNFRLFPISILLAVGISNMANITENDIFI